jgi:hypothetical protein
MGNHKASEIAELKRLIDEGIRSGPSVDAEVVFARLREKLARGREPAKPGRDNP